MLSNHHHSVSRRNFLQVGTAAVGSLTLGASALASGSLSRHTTRGGDKAVIMILLPGGPSHVDLFDPKLEARAEVRGGLRALRTNVPGVQVSELLPRTAAVMDKCVLVRSIVDATGDHHPMQCVTGRSLAGAPAGGWPSLGAVLAERSTGGAVSPFVAVGAADVGTPGFLGQRRAATHYSLGNQSPALIAQQLIASGTKCVTLSLGDWDQHSTRLPALRRNAALLDATIAELVTWLYDTGRDQDVSLCVWGEFGRSPLVNKYGGRDHWTAVTSALLAGGGMRTGQVIGRTDRDGGAVVERPLSFGDVLATLYHNLGIDPHSRVQDLAGRRHTLVDSQARVIAELV